MASYTSINAYDADLRVPSFAGLRQYGDGINEAPVYAVQAKNLQTKNGVLQPFAAGVAMTATLPTPIKTLARLYRRWHSTESERQVLVAATGGQLYYMLPTSTAWTKLTPPDGFASFASDEWSCVTYEVNDSTVASVDVLLLSNAKDGMLMLRGDSLKLSVVDTKEKKFGVIERYAERIWGGAIENDPDTLMYSAVYDPTDWEANTEIPEDGAGDVNQPSWDGDSFTALRSFGSQLIAFKRTRVWRVLGTDPGEYTFKEQYGGGAPFENTVAVDTERIFMLTRRGVVYYDGAAVSPFQQDTCEKVWQRVNQNALSGACGCVWHENYYVSLPLDSSTINNAVLIYNGTDGTWLLREDLNVQQFLPGQETLYYTSSTSPGKVFTWQEDSWLTTPTSAACEWVSPWFDMGYRRITKLDTYVYILCEVKNTAVTLHVSLQTEKKTRTRDVVIKPLQGQDEQFKQVRIHFPGEWDRARFIIRTDAGAPAWRLIGGLQLNADLSSNND